MKRLLAILVVSAFVFNLNAAPEPHKKKKRTKAGLYLTAKEAVDFIKKHKDNVVFIDVRTRAEVEYVGYSYLMDKNIPIHFKNFKKWSKKKHRFLDAPRNKHFVKDVEKVVSKKGLNKDNAILIMMCRSGSRSAKAANMMYKAGYKKVYSIVDGFEGGKDKKYKHRIVNGWKNTTPPETWGYKLDKTKMYLY